MHEGVHNRPPETFVDSGGPVHPTVLKTSMSSSSIPPLRGEGGQIMKELIFLYEQLRPRLLRMVQGRIGPRLRGRIDAEDVLQDALRRLVENLDEKRPASEEQLRAWLFKKVWSQLQDELRRWNTSQRDVDRVGPLPDESIADLIHRIGLSTRLGLEDVVELIRRALKPTEFEIIWLRIVDELSYGEIAEIFDLAEDTVRKRHVRALLKVRKSFSDPFASSGGSAPV
jgi:RNA polymerase sigma-70 factor (ECF subfamily)